MDTTSDYINIQNHENNKWKSCTIYDFAEQKIKSGKLGRCNNKESIDISGLQIGIYFMLLKDIQGKYGLGKFVVE